MLLSNVILREGVWLSEELFGDADDDVLAAHPVFSFRRLRYSDRLTWNIKKKKKKIFYNISIFFSQNN